MKQITEFGRLRANPFAKGTMWKAEDCAQPATCEDYFSNTVTGTDEIISMLWEGQTITFDTPIPANQPDVLQAAIENHLSTNTTKQEFDVWVRVTYVGTTLTIQHRGATTITSFATDAPATLTMTRNCNIAVYCDYQALIVGAATPITIDGADVVLANSPYNYSGVPGTDATTAGQLDTDITAALTGESTDFKTVTVAVDNALEGFVVTIKAIRGTVISINDSTFAELACTQEFVA